MPRYIAFLAALFLVSLALPAAASADTARVTVTLHMRAGPSTEFPVVATIDEGARVLVHGCVRGYRWCDVSSAGSRGWVDADYLTYPYHDSYVPIIDYGAEIDLPIIGFDVYSYWDDYYRGRPWYHRRHYWHDYWRHHHHRDRHRRVHHRRHDHRAVLHRHARPHRINRSDFRHHRRSRHVIRHHHRRRHFDRGRHVRHRNFRPRHDGHHLVHRGAGRGHPDGRRGQGGERRHR